MKNGEYGKIEWKSFYWGVELECEVGFLKGLNMSKRTFNNIIEEISWIWGVLRCVEEPWKKLTVALHIIEFCCGLTLLIFLKEHMLAFNRFFKAWTCKRTSDYKRFAQVATNKTLIYSKTMNSN